MIPRSVSSLTSPPLPEAMQYKGTYDASGGTYPSSPSQGYYWVISVQGTLGGVLYKVGDWLTYNGTGWDKIDNQATVSSVAGRTGAVVLAEGDITNLTTDLAAKESTANKGTASGYAPLDSGSKVPTTNLGGAGADNTKFLRGDQTWMAPPGTSDATSSSKGVIQLTGDLGGTAASPTVPGLANKVSSVAATDATITVGGSATAPTVGVNAIPESKVTGLTTDLAATEKTANKGTASGYAGLDSGGKVPSAQLPASVVGALEYQGTYDASGGTYPAVPSKGYYWVISVQGTLGGVLYKVGDWLAYNGTTWDKVDNQQTVSSVAGRVGAVTLTTADVAASANKNYVTDAQQTVIGNTSGANTGDQDVSGLVPKTTTVNGHALSSNVSVTATDVGLGSVTNDAQLKASNLDADGTLAANSDTKVASQKATKTYADTKLGLHAKADTAAAADTVTTNANLTGDVTSVGNATTIAPKAVTLAKMNDMATSSLIYRKTAATGAPEVNSLATLKTDLGLTGTNSGDQTLPTDATLSVTDVTTNNVSTAKHGFAPRAPNDSTKYLDGTGGYSVPAGAATPDADASTKGKVQLNNDFGGTAGSPTVVATHLSAALPVLQGGTGVTTKTGTGNVVLSTSPALTTPTGIVKGDVGLGNVDNTSDATKPVSTAQQTALNLKQDTSAKGLPAAMPASTPAPKFPPPTWAAPVPTAPSFCAATRRGRLHRQVPWSCPVAPMTLPPCRRPSTVCPARARSYWPGTFLWNSAVPALPRDATGISIRGSGCGVTTIRLSSGAPRCFDFARIADHDVFQNIELSDFTVDANNTTGQHHVLWGNYRDDASSVMRMNFRRLRAYRIDMINVLNDPTTTTHRLCVVFTGWQAAAGEATQNYIVDVLHEDITMSGGNAGILINGGLSSYASGVNANIYLDLIRTIAALGMPEAPPRPAIPLADSRSASLHLPIAFG